MTTLTPITAVIPSFTVTPVINTPTFPEDIDQYNVEIPAVITAQQDTTDQINNLIPQLNELETNVNAMEASTVEASEAAVAAANYEGDWVNQGYTKGHSVSYSGSTYACKLTHVTGFVPTNTTYWQPIGLVAIINNATAKTTPVDADEFGFLDSASSWIMKKLTWGDIKTVLGAIFAPKISPTFTGTVVLPSTTSIGTITNTELGYLDGVTSAIQTQLNAKQASLGFTPVQQGGGSEQWGNKVYIGWSPVGLKVQVDASDLGKVWIDNNNPSYKGSNGYQKLASGLIIQWGYSAPGTATFPIAFPNFCLQVLVQIVSSGSAFDAGHVNPTFSTTGFTRVIQTTACRWIAIGY